MKSLKCMLVGDTLVPSAVSSVDTGSEFAVQLPYSEGSITVRNARTRKSFQLTNGHATIPAGTIVEGGYTIGYKAGPLDPGVNICCAICVDGKILFLWDNRYLAPFCKRVRALEEKVGILEKTVRELADKVYGYKLF